MVGVTRSAPHQWPKYLNWNHDDFFESNKTLPKIFCVVLSLELTPVLVPVRDEQITLKFLSIVFHISFFLTDFPILHLQRERGIHSNYWMIVGFTSTQGVGVSAENNSG